MFQGLWQIYFLAAMFSGYAPIYRQLLPTIVRGLPDIVHQAYIDFSWGLWLYHHPVLNVFAGCGDVHFC